MHPEISKFKRKPVGYLTNAAGQRTHAIVPLEEPLDEWDALPTATPDEVDCAFLARFEGHPAEFLDLAPVTNPIRAARSKAGITQEALARALGISAAALSKQERENHTPRPKTLERALSKLQEMGR